MVMSKGKTKKVPKFNVEGQDLKHTSRVNYLGFIITSNMNNSVMIEDRILKANRASYIWVKAKKMKLKNVEKWKIHIHCKKN